MAGQKDEQDQGQVTVDRRRLKKLSQACGSVENAEHNVGLRFRQLEDVFNDLMEGDPADPEEPKIASHQALCELRDMLGDLSGSVRSMRRRLNRLMGEPDPEPK